jgi:hypothetical protein
MRSDNLVTRERSQDLQFHSGLDIGIRSTRPSINGRRSHYSEVGDKRLKGIRVMETTPGVTRVVLDLESPAEFTVSRLDNPTRMIIELRPAGATPMPH